MDDKIFSGFTVIEHFTKKTELTSKAFYEVGKAMVSGFDEGVNDFIKIASKMLRKNRNYKRYLRRYARGRKK